MILLADMEHTTYEPLIEMLNAAWDMFSDKYNGKNLKENLRYYRDYPVRLSFADLMSLFSILVKKYF